MRLGTAAAVAQSSASFGQVTTSRRKDSSKIRSDISERIERARLHAEVSPAKQSESKNLLSQLQRLQLLQQEAQSLLI